MTEKPSGSKRNLGTLGSDLTMDDLPPSNTKRWQHPHKAIIVSAVRDGLITFEEIVHLYGITHEEFLSWERLLDEHGLPGLRTTYLPKYRKRAGLPESVVS